MVISSAGRREQPIYAAVAAYWTNDKPERASMATSGTSTCPAHRLE
jgi:hypothetical protein